MDIEYVYVIQAPGGKWWTGSNWHDEYPEAKKYKTWRKADDARLAMPDELYIEGTKVEEIELYQ